MFKGKKQQHTQQINKNKKIKKRKEEKSSNKCVLSEQGKCKANEQAKYIKNTNWLSLGFVLS